jgi:ubiquinone/menaquinone biosynthesis C-methylase UbiE
MEQDKIKDYYAHDIEANRLELEPFKLEGIRTKEIIERYLPKNSIDILDIGGGAGFYSFWLQQKGHNVTLVDLSPGNIELVRKQSESSGIALKKFETGDAIDLQFPDQQFDLVLLFGPLYHLIDQKERIKALSEARRVLKPGGVLLSAIISRYASLFDGFQRNLVFDDQFFKLMTDDLKTGIHKNETDNLEYFTTAYFHTADEIKAEIEEAGLKFEKLIPVESFGWIVNDFNEKMKDSGYMEKLLATIRRVESNEGLLAMSPHIIAVTRKE